jgi:hypothetical protein
MLSHRPDTVKLIDGVGGVARSSEEVSIMGGTPIRLPGGCALHGRPTFRWCATILAAAEITCFSARLAEPPAQAAEPAVAEVRERNVVRKQLPKHVKSIALEYTVIAVDDTGKEQFVDPHAHTFKVGDSFLVRIRPQDDVYVYVFNEGPTGERSCLLPSEGEKPPLVKKGAEISLPDDGGYFTFSEPAGEEKLVVVALTEPNDDLQLLTSAVFKSGRSAAENLTSEQREAKKRADAGMESLRQRAGTGVQSRGPVRKVVERVEGLGADGRVTHVEPPRPGETSSYGIAVSAGDPELFLDIPLHSRAPSK